MTEPAEAPMPAGLTEQPAGYAAWLAEVKARVQTAQQRAALAVNHELIWLYWQIGRDILARQVEQGWGAKVIDRLAHDLRSAFPEMKGFSRANLMYMRAFAEAWGDAEIVQQLVGRLPWGHNLVLLTKLKDMPTRRKYAQRAIEQGWSRNVLGMQIDARATIGLLLCRTKNRVVAEYALRDSNKPIGVAEYQLVEALPDELQTSLPSIEQIERELGTIDNNMPDEAR